MEKQANNLPKELKNLVNKTVSLLGEVIVEEGGQDLFKEVEFIRKQMIEYRKASKEKKQGLLQSQYKKMNNNDSKRNREIAHSFTLMLEIVNTCETSYRTFRLKEDKSVLKLKKRNNALIYVLTAHPTEARTTQNIELFHSIQDLCLRILEKSGEEDYLLSIIKHNLKLAWLLPITRHEKPLVIDEAKHLFSIILRPDIFDTILRANRELGVVRVRTWVGGDKDGHPGVNGKVMLHCLQASREYFVKIIDNIFDKIFREIDGLGNTNILRDLEIFRKTLTKVKKVKGNDAENVKIFKSSLDSFNKSYKKFVGAENPRLRKLKLITELFPGLVIPIEIREDSEIIEQSLSSKRPLAIEEMLRTLKEIAGDENIRCYAEGMIISMCQSFKDVSNTKKLVKKSIGSLSLPIIPLFETAEALENSTLIVNQILDDREFTHQIRKKWNNKLEIMLGYSDSSKGMGVLASRLGIAKAMRSLDKIIRDEEITPVFFHGSGGSVDRGGGSLQEQTAWWPKSALQLYKATIQGEMVERNFSSREVTLSGMDKILTNLDKVKSREGSIRIDKEVEKFSKIVEDQYVSKINNPDFFKMVEQATPYSYLNVLKLGSRPTKRAKAAALDFRSIRAIPWVLCWTQTRTLFPSWWGVGTAWTIYRSDRLRSEKLKESYEKSYIFSSFIRTLGFTLSKVDLQVFKLYLSRSDLCPADQNKVFEEFDSEYRLACQFVCFLSGERNLLWFRPWLKDSINLRSSMIHPLNILQIIGHQSDDLDLVRTTVAGISLGMMTTG